MNAHIQYEDPMQAARSRSCAVRWLSEHGILDDTAIERQFGIDAQTMTRIRDGEPLLVGDDAAVRADRMVATQSLLLDGYSSDGMVKWFRTPLPGLDGLAASQLLCDTADATSDVLEAAEAWMA